MSEHPEALYNEMERLELSLLQEIWQLESSLLHLIRQVQDLQIQMERLRGAENEISGLYTKYLPEAD